MFNKIKEKIRNFKPGFNYCWLSFLFIFLIFFNFSYYLNADEGIILTGAWNLLNGRQIYIDWFSFIPPGSFYFILIIWEIFFPNYLIAKFFALLIIFFAAIGVYKISQLITKKQHSAYCLLAPSLFIASSLGWPVINHNCFNIALVIWSIYLFLKSLDDKNNYQNALLSGVLLGIASLFLLHKSLLIFSFFNLWLFLNFSISREKKELKNIFLFNFAFIVLASTIFLFASPHAIYENLIKYPLLNYGEVNKVSLHFLIVSLMVILMSFLYLAPTMKKNKYFKFIFWLQLVIILSTIQRPDSFHISIMFFPLIALVPTIAESLSTAKIETNRLIFILLPLIICVLLIPSLFNIIYAPPFYFFYQSPKLSYINENCKNSEYIYAGPFMPGLYFAAKKNQPTPFSFLITNHQTEEQFLQAKKDLEAKKPICIIMDYEMVEKFKYNRNNPVDQYIDNHYHLVKTINHTQIYKLNSSSQ